MQKKKKKKKLLHPAVWSGTPWRPANGQMCGRAGWASAAKKRASVGEGVASIGAVGQRVAVMHGAFFQPSNPQAVVGRAFHPTLGSMCTMQSELARGKAGGGLEEAAGPTRVAAKQRMSGRCLGAHLCRHGAGAGGAARVAGCAGGNLERDQGGGALQHARLSDALGCWRALERQGGAARVEQQGSRNVTRTHALSLYQCTTQYLPWPCGALPTEAAHSGGPHRAPWVPAEAGT